MMAAVQAFQVRAGNTTAAENALEDVMGMCDMLMTEGK